MVNKILTYRLDKSCGATCRDFPGWYDCVIKHLKQPIARRANEEIGAKGHVWDGRFYSGALLTDEALLAAMAYVDLNPVRAGIAARIEACRHTSIAERLQENSAEALEAYLAPLASGLGDGPAAEIPAAAAQAPASDEALASGAPAGPVPVAEAHAVAESPQRRPPISLRDYIDMVRGMAEATVASPRPRPDRVAAWLARMAVLGKRQRAYGSKDSLARWIGQRGLQFRETPLPA